MAVAAEHPPTYLAGLPLLLQEVVTLPVEETVAHKAGEVGAGLMDRGLAMGTPDLLIASTALVHGHTLVTHNTQDFVHVPGLSLLDWLIP